MMVSVSVSHPIVTMFIVMPTVIPDHFGKVIF